MSTTLERPATAVAPPDLPEIAPEESPWANLIFNGPPAVIEDAPPVEHEPTESFHEAYQREQQRVSTMLAEANRAHREHQDTMLMSSQCPVCVASYYSCSTDRASYIRGSR